MADSTKVCVVGAGAVGGVLGGRLAAAGVPVSALARGATRDALRTHGWRVDASSSPVAAVSDDAADLGPQDVVIIAVKSHHLPALAPSLTPLITPSTVVVPALNGVPWWFFHDFGGALEGTVLDATDPDRTVTAALPPSQVLGCVVHLAADQAEPGHALLTAGDELIIGEPSGALSDRAGQTAALLRTGGFRVTVSDAIQRDVWFKLWGNMTMNPISALTGATADLVLDDPLVNAFIQRVMTEAAALGALIGAPIAQSAEDRIAVTRRLGAFKTSMLQDAESGRPIELDALVTAVSEIGARLAIPTPNIDALLGLTRLAARRRGLYSGA
ncbi:2-dehydropantoate 2-reductase [Catenuloplanes nepalensis]|uniref:2-dehydropantoate 2-reductase n=1 Tax=Catenuloplanes nepalensis TaxID=587533 RepID=A0ABT9MSF6_9ACTN|nr:2-dehydropantoate 2-reductase [Catenuloplanes nepalensis]MDP9794365.1 2-dehydropantoate 2-reductase [Catenuloplanes nepalensis]